MPTSLRMILIVVASLVFSLELEAQMPLTPLYPLDFGGCVPGVILTDGDCALMGGIFCNPNGTLWQENMNDGSGCVIPSFPFPGIVFEGGCEPYEYSTVPAYAPVPTTVTLPTGEVLNLVCPPLPFSGQVYWVVQDACGDVIEFTFDLDLQCVNCPPSSGCAGGNFIEACSHCENATPDPSTPCYSCDATVLDGFCACTPPGSSAIDNSQFNNPLCDDDFFPNNMSWFSFTAGSPEISLNVVDIECLGGSTGIQTGIYAECEMGECLASDNDCGTTEDKSFSLTDLTVGDTYFIYVDGCAGSACNFRIELTGVAAFELDEPLAVTAITASQGQLGDPCDRNNVITICEGESVVVIAHHDGTSSSDFGIYDEECSIYDPALEAVFTWSFTPEINGMSFESFVAPDEMVPPLTPPAGTYEICLEGVNHECDDTAERACMTLIVTQCAPTDNDGDGVAADQDCDDSDPNNYPGNIEICDNQDNNCNGQIDEGITQPTAPILSCAAVGSDFVTVIWNQNPIAQIYNVYLNGILFTSTVNNSATFSNLISATSYSIRVDVVFNNGCAGLSSNINCATSTVADNDGDGSPAGVDCDDNDPNNYPGNAEDCDGQDNNCNGQVDEGFSQNLAPSLICADTGTDFITVSWATNSTAQIYNVFLNGSFFTSTTGTSITISGLNPNATNVVRIEIIFNNGCTAMESVITCSTGMVGDADGDGSPDNEDCDNNDPNNFPGNTEFCDGQDNNCDNQIDEGLSFQDYYVDTDEDGFGSDDEVVNDCAQPMGFVTSADDCDDNDPMINPGVDEIPNNGVDENCDGEIEIIDLDGDGWNSDLDCDDFNAAINPGATEVPGNGIDEDCDGEDGPSSTYELAKAKINIYPNPVVDHITIDVQGQLNYRARIFDLKGQLVFTSENQKIIEISSLPQGSYLLEIMDAESGHRVVERIVKIN